MNLSSSVEMIKGVGEKTAEQLEQAGLATVRDIVEFLPRTYDDYSQVQTIQAVQPGKITIKARCEKVVTKRVRRGLSVTTATLADDSAKLQAVWFNQPYRATQLQSNDWFLFTGTYEFSYNRYQLSNPSVEQAPDEAPVRDKDHIQPVYRAVAGIKQHVFRKLYHALEPLVIMLPEIMPEDIIADEKLLSRGAAYHALHYPRSMEEVEKARERVAFDELFELLLGAQLNKQANESLQGWNIPFEQSIIKRFVENLPFALTGAQRRAAWDILQDFEQGVPMNRLLQGDVGSGKTVVAGLGALQAAHHQFQSAIMAPTEILASQHAETLHQLLEPFGVRVALLTGSVKGRARTAVLDAIESGEVDVVVGTHALIQRTVSFHKLGFVVIDEQHRFGVKQRQELLHKSERLPHLLAMSATPIPRSLALTLYGELEISVLNELPAGRKPIKTKLISPNSRTQLYEQIELELASGRQAYVICSLIDESADNDRRSVEAEYKRLNVGPFKHRKIGLLHGKLKPDEKDAVMQQFARGEIDILVSTTVVEVGVNVPNATIMLIEDADRFGLSQLHQLRGRVGRSSRQSYCYLVLSTSAKPTQRLQEIEKSNDGFYLAEVDLRLRGPGEVYGRAQHGALNLQIATLADTKLLDRAQRQAKAFIASGKKLVQYEELEKRVEYYRRLTTLN